MENSEENMHVNIRALGLRSVFIYLGRERRGVKFLV